MRPVEHRPYMPPSGGGQPYPASRDMTTPFPFGFLLAMLWDIKPRGNGKPWAMEPAVEDTDGRSASDRTRPRFFFFGLCSTRMGYKAKGKWEALGDGACRRRYGRPERERSYKTSLFLLWLMLHPISLPGYRLPV